MNLKQTEFIKDLNTNFETKTRDNGEDFICLNDTVSDELKDAIREIHGTDILPDDYRYRFISELFSNINDFINYNENATVEDLGEHIAELTDSVISIYYHDLNKWFASNLSRAEFVNESLAMNDYEDIHQHLQFGQASEINEIFERILNELDKL